MLTYNENEVIAKLDNVSERGRILFALSASTRVSPLCDLYRRKYKLVGESLSDCGGEIWSMLLENRLSSEKLRELQEKILELMPDADRDGEGSDSFGSLYAEDAVASMIYAIMTILKPISQEAAWAARRAYELVDQYAIKSGKIFSPGKKDEIKIIANPIVQGELEHQQLDLADVERMGMNEKSTHGSIMDRSMRYSRKISKIIYE